MAPIYGDWLPACNAAAPVEQVSGWSETSGALEVPWPPVWIHR
jgi:hypothetical protein